MCNCMELGGRFDSFKSILMKVLEIKKRLYSMVLRGLMHRPMRRNREYHLILPMERNQLLVVLSCLRLQQQLALVIPQQ